MELRYIFAIDGDWKVYAYSPVNKEINNHERLTQIKKMLVDFFEKDDIGSATQYLIVK